MPLGLVDDTLDNGRGYCQAQAGKLVQLMRGIYVDEGDDIDATVPSDARIKGLRK